MSYVEYEKAQKLGLKAFKNAVSKGENEYLPVLDEILEGVDIVGEMPLGIVQIPLDRWNEQCRKNIRICEQLHATA